MARTEARPSDIAIDYRAEMAADPDEFGQLLAPVLAGARARGVADAFELMGVAAVLIDGSGRVLHAGGRAERALRPLVKIIGGHLVGADPETNDRLQSVVAAAIGSDAAFADIETEFKDPAGEVRLAMTPRRFPQEEIAGCQLLRGLLIITECFA